MKQFEQFETPVPLDPIAAARAARERIIRAERAFQSVPPKPSKVRIIPVRQFNPAHLLPKVIPGTFLANGRICRYAPAPFPCAPKAPATSKRQFIRQVSTDEIKNLFLAVAVEYGVDFELMITPGRTRLTTRAIARQVACYRAHKDLGASYVQIAEATGLDRGSIHYAAKVQEARASGKLDEFRKYHSEAVRNWQSKIRERQSNGMRGEQ